MSRRDKAVAGALVVVLAAIAFVVAQPARAPAAPLPTASPSPAAVPVPYREGIVGRPVSVNPLTARTQTDRDLVGLLFPGLVTLGDGEAFQPGLADSWSAREDGTAWTFRIRHDARWHDGTPVTTADVAFTIATIQDPAYTGPAGASWRDVTVNVVDPRTVRFELAAPLAGFLPAALQPIAPAHLLSGIPLAELEGHPFGLAPTGSGAWQLESLDDQRAVLVPTGPPGPGEGEPAASPRQASPDSLASARPTPRPERLPPAVLRLELSFFDDADALEAAYAGGELDAAFGLPPDVAGRIAAAPDSRLLRYPGSTVTAVALNLRPSEPAFRTAAIRRALLAAIDRAGLIDDAFGGAGLRADSLIPPGSFAFDVAASTAIAHDVAAAERELAAADWEKDDDGWRLAGASEPLNVELLSPDEEASPAVFAAARRVAADWESIGIDVTHVGLPPADLVGDRLQASRFSAVVLDIAVGLDPDLYALLASSQTTTGRTNFTGLQDPQVDRLLEAARTPGSDDARRAAYGALQEHLAAQQYVLPLAFRDVIVVARSRVEERDLRRLTDPSGRFWDLLRWELASDQ